MVLSLLSAMSQASVDLGAVKFAPSVKVYWMLSQVETKKNSKRDNITNYDQYAAKGCRRRSLLKSYVMKRNQL